MLPLEPTPAYSYIRFSHPTQAKGDSRRRQTEAALAWCERNNAKLDTTLTFKDLGKSAFLGEHRKNPDRHDLARFLKLVEQGKVSEGSYLILENLDRLTREHIRPALTLLLNLIEAGIRVVQLKPCEQVYDRNVEPMVLMMALMELSRGHSESAMKSERVGGAWSEKKRRARDGETQKPTERMGKDCQVITRRLPGWLEEQDGKVVPIPKLVEVVRLIFQMAANKQGLSAIVKHLSTDKVPAFGESETWVDEDGKTHRKAKEGSRLGAGHWSRSYVGLLLKDRRVLGEFQPRKIDGSPDGPVITNYYPAIVTPEEFTAARAGAEERRVNHTSKQRTRWGWSPEQDEVVKAQSINNAAKQLKRPRSAVLQRRVQLGLVSSDKRVIPAGEEQPAQINVFAGLLKNARGKDSYICVTRTDGGQRCRVLVNTDCTEGRAPCWSFPYPTFEAALLCCLKEIDPVDIINGDNGPEAVLALSMALEKVEGELLAMVGYMEKHGFSATIGQRIQALETQKRELVEKLAVAREREARPLSESWGQAKTLLVALSTAPDRMEAYQRLRTSLRRIVESIWVLVVPRGRDRLAMVQMSFAGGGRRDYLIWHRPAKSNGKARVEGSYRVRSWLKSDYAAAGLEQDSLSDPEAAGGVYVEGTIGYLESLKPEHLELVFRNCEPHPLP